MKKGKIIAVTIAVLCCAAVSGYGIWYYWNWSLPVYEGRYQDMANMGLYPAIGGGALAVLIIALTVVGAIRDKVGSKKLKKSLEEKEKARLTMIESGMWQFPSKDFYERCLAEYITEIDSSFAEQKVRAIAKQIFTEQKIPEIYQAQYCSKGQLTQYLADGKKYTNEAEAAKREECRKPKVGQLPEKEQQAVELSKRLCSLYGTEKRIAMLDDALQKTSKKISDYTEGQKALKQVGVLLATSVAQEKKKDWAFLGGLADGIAGPGAGVAVAANVMLQNQEIEHRNQQARRMAMETVREFYSSAHQITNDIDDLRNQQKLLNYHKKQAQIKVVLEDSSSDEIFEGLTIKTEAKKTKDGKGLVLSAKICNRFAVNVPSHVQVAVDGTLVAEVFYENTLVDTVYIALPLFGVAYEATEEVEAYTDRYVEADGKYRVKISPNKLWIVEV